jgi:hypothetical protein
VLRVHADMSEEEQKDAVEKKPEPEPEAAPKADEEA